MLLYALIDDPRSLSLFEQIYQNYRAGMYHIAFAVLHDTQLAEDSVSEAFMRIAKHINKISDMTCKERADYIVIITRNAAIDIYRKCENNAVPLDFIEAMPDMETAEQAAVSHLSYGRIMVAIEQLQDNYRDVLKLRCLYGHSAEETARLLGITPNTVNQQLRRAKAKLLKILREEDLYHGS